MGMLGDDASSENTSGDRKRRKILREDILLESVTPYSPSSDDSVPWEKDAERDAAAAAAEKGRRADRLYILAIHHKFVPVTTTLTATKDAVVEATLRSFLASTTKRSGGNVGNNVAINRWKGVVVNEKWVMEVVRNGFERVCNIMIDAFATDVSGRMAEMYGIPIGTDTTGEKILEDRGEGSEMMEERYPERLRNNRTSVDNHPNSVEKVVDGCSGGDDNGDEKETMILTINSGKGEGISFSENTQKNSLKIAGEEGPAVIDICSSDSDENDDNAIAISGSSTFSLTKKRQITSSSTNQSYPPSVRFPSVERTIRPFPPFQPRFLRSHKYSVEARTRPGPPTPSDLEERKKVSDALALHLNGRKRQSGEKSKYYFEKCYERYLQFLDHPPSSLSHPSSSSSLLPPTTSIHSKNIAIASRLRLLITAEMNIEILQHMRRGGGSLDKVTQKFREEAYERVAKKVETHPVELTVDHIVNKERRSASSRSMPVIRCGGTVHDRLLRAVALEHATNEFLLTNSEHHADETLLQNQEAAAMSRLSKIWGVGRASAARLVTYGMGTIEDIRKDMKVYKALNPQQKVGVDRYEDLNTRIPRNEADHMLAIISDAVREVCGGSVQVIGAGSYRRGARDHHDIDYILLPKHASPLMCREEDEECHRNVGGDDDDLIAVSSLNDILSRLRLMGLLTDDLTLPGQFGEGEYGTGCLSYMGVCRLPNSKEAGERQQHDGRQRSLYRRIDIKAYPGCQATTALVYFTGDAWFNRSLRACAKNAGLTLR